MGGPFTLLSFFNQQTIQNAQKVVFTGLRGFSGMKTYISNPFINPTHSNLQLFSGEITEDGIKIRNKWDSETSKRQKRQSFE